MMTNTVIVTIVSLGLSLLLVACGSTGPTVQPEATETVASPGVTNQIESGRETEVPAAEVEPMEEKTATDQFTELPLARPENQLDDREYSWNQLLSRDAIQPIYDPEFAPADEAPYEDQELVIGVEINGEAKAYAIGPLNGREMVNDTVGGTPVLVTW